MGGGGQWGCSQVPPPPESSRTSFRGKRHPIPAAHLRQGCWYHLFNKSPLYLLPCHINSLILTALVLPHFRKWQLHLCIHQSVLIPEPLPPTSTHQVPPVQLLGSSQDPPAPTQALVIPALDQNNLVCQKNLPTMPS